MIEVRTAHTSSLDALELQEIRAFLDDAFEGAFDEHDWDHTIGGVHAVARDEHALVAHASVVQRRLLHDGRALRAGYVEAVAVRADLRRRGYGRAVMERIEEVLAAAYDLGALSAADDAGCLYRSLGWSAWEGETWVLGPEGPQRTPDDDGGIYVLPLGTTLDLAGDLFCDWRDGDAW